MEPVFNERKTRAWLEPLSRRARAAFVLACVERMRPSLGAFLRERGEDLSAPIDEIVDAAWSLIDGSEPEPDLDDLGERFRQLPQVDAHNESIHAGPATNASCAIALLLDTLGSGSLDKAIEAAAVAADSAESYALTDLGLPADAENLEARVAAHPLVQRELKFQRDDIRQLRQTSLDRSESVAALRREWRARSRWKLSQ
jgi:uncharacterized protein YjaG (DUF416 family)